ncbi:MAG: hypothetical protein EZS28_027572 [Streblomastix strix]|uniref:Uncharacterized protein n=1 Tax=Streblomastix strix TaxID=222440 RepID=A0A5J4V471_9EUKA|nr:MAG: hypothetical protein EZS28_027572 [Streblomastix strix]
MEDSHQFIRTPLEQAHYATIAQTNKMIPMGIEATCVDHQIFDEILQSPVKCRKYGYETKAFDPFLGYSLDIDIV